MNEAIIATTPMASLAFSLLYSHAGYESNKPTNSNQFVSTLHSHLIAILPVRARQALKPPPSASGSTKPITICTIPSVMTSYLPRTGMGMKTFIYLRDLLRRQYPYGISSSCLPMKALKLLSIHMLLPCSWLTLIATDVRGLCPILPVMQ